MRRAPLSRFGCVAVVVSAFGCGSDRASPPPTNGLDASSLGDARSGGTGPDAAGGGEESGTGGHSDSGSGSDAGARPDGGAPNASKICPAVSPGDNEQYHLPAVATLPTGLSAITDWQLYPESGGFNGKQAMDDCRLQADGFLTSHGKAAARVEVQPGDDPLALGEGTERAEMFALQTPAGTEIDESAGSGVQYYATSYYFPTTWAGTGLEGDSNSWSIVAQFHPTGDGTWGFLYAGASTTGGAQRYSAGFGGSSLAFSDGGAIALGQWTDFVVEIDWGASVVSIWRRDDGQTHFTEVITSQSVPAPTSSCYFKQGLYRGGDVNGRTDVYWFGPTGRGSSFSAVEQAIFGTNVGP